MRHTRFIELLNLYVDQEITVDQAGELEAEILRNPKRRHTYNQYCKLQRACVSLFESENAQAPVPHLGKLMQAVEAVDAKVEAFPNEKSFSDPQSSPVWWQRMAVGGAVAASFVLVGTVAWRQLGPAPASPSASTASMPAYVATKPVVASAPSPTSGEMVQLATLERRPAREETSESARSALYLKSWLQSAALSEGRNGEYANNATAPVDLEWTRGVELAPINSVKPEELRFESRAAFASPSESRTFRGRGAPAANVELSAFQFQR